MGQDKTFRERASAVVVHAGQLLTVRFEDPVTKTLRHYLPGGALEPGEAPAAAAARETLEETGYGIHVDAASGVIRTYDFLWNGVTYACRTHFFAGSLAAPHAPAATVDDADYHRGVEWLPVAAVPAALGFHADILEVVTEIMLRRAPMQAEPQFRSFQEFWPFYVREHANAANRRLHFVGTAIVIALAGLALASGRWGLLLLMPVAGYGCAWVGHFVVQKNRPATFKHPLWSLAGDFKMFGYMCIGRMDAEVERATNTRE